MWSRCALLATLIAMVFHAAPVAAEEIEFGRYHALVIGNNDYADLPRLETAVADAEAVAALLESKYGFQVRLLRNATRADILRGLNAYRAELTDGDNLLIYYAGHGYFDRPSETGFWQPVDAEMYDDLNWISNEDLTRRINAMTANHVMVIADSCYSGTLVRAAETQLPTGGDRETWLRRMAGKRSRTAMVSGGLEPVSDAGQDGHSVFASALLEALEENQTILDGQTLFQNISRPVVVNADQTPEYSDIRQAGHEGGEFIFVPIIVMPETAPANPDTGNRAVELAFWQAIQDSDRPSDFAAYLEQFPEGGFAPLARSRMAALDDAARESSPAERLAGAWVSEVLTNPYEKSDTYRLHFDFKIIGDRLLGSVVEKSTPDAPRPYTVSRAMLDGKIDNGVVTFRTPFEVLIGTSREKHNKEYTGILGDGRLTLIVQDDQGTPAREFAASRPNSGE